MHKRLHMTVLFQRCQANHFWHPQTATGPELKLNLRRDINELTTALVMELNYKMYCVNIKSE
jgi:hypothetical protein